jgi:hypothetical protein
MRRQPEHVARLAQQFPASNQKPSLLLMGIAASFILQDEAKNNVEKIDQGDCQILQRVWDELTGSNVSMWLMVSDACASEAAFEEALGKLLNDEESVTTLQFIQMVATVGHVQKMRAQENPSSGIRIDPRKAILSDFVNIYSDQGGIVAGVVPKLVQVEREVEQLMEPML